MENVCSIVGDCIYPKCGYCYNGVHLEFMQGTIKFLNYVLLIAGIEKLKKKQRIAVNVHDKIVDFQRLFVL